MKQAITVFKALADENRLKILRELSQREMYIELLAQRLQLTPATISFHIKKLQEAGFLKSRREQYYVLYSLREEALDVKLKDLVREGEGSGKAGEMGEEMYRQKVLKAFMPYGKCDVLPAQVKKRMIIYEEIARQFEEGKEYNEKEVNEIIARIHEDYCTVRRAFIGMGWMERHGTVYKMLGIREADENAHRL